MIRLGVPSKGRLMEQAFSWFAARGVGLARTGSERDYTGRVEGAEGVSLVMLSAGEIPRELAAGRIDLDYLARYTDAPLLVDEQTGLFLRDQDGRALVIDRATGGLAAFDGRGVRPDLNAAHPGHSTVLQLMAERYLQPEYAPEAVADRCGSHDQQRALLEAALVETPRRPLAAKPSRISCVSRLAAVSAKSSVGASTGSVPSRSDGSMPRCSARASSPIARAAKTARAACGAVICACIARRPASHNVPASVMAPAACKAAVARCSIRACAKAAARALRSCDRTVSRAAVSRPATASQSRPRK